MANLDAAQATETELAMAQMVANFLTSAYGDTDSAIEALTQGLANDDLSDIIAGVEHSRSAMKKMGEKVMTNQSAFCEMVYQKIA